MLDLLKQYIKLKAIALSAENFFWADDETELYQGHIAPKGLAVQTNTYYHSLSYMLMLAERVPIRFAEPDFDEEEAGEEISELCIVTARLDNNLEFISYEPSSKTIGGLAYDNFKHDGTFWSWSQYYATKPNAQISNTILFLEHENFGLTSLLMLKGFHEPYKKPL